MKPSTFLPNIFSHAFVAIVAAAVTLAAPQIWPHSKRDSFCGMSFNEAIVNPPPGMDINGKIVDSFAPLPDGRGISPETLELQRLADEAVQEAKAAEEAARANHRNGGILAAKAQNLEPFKQKMLEAAQAGNYSVNLLTETITNPLDGWDSHNCPPSGPCAITLGGEHDVRIDYYAAFVAELSARLGVDVDFSSNCEVLTKQNTCDVTISADWYPLYSGNFQVIPS